MGLDKLKSYILSQEFRKRITWAAFDFLVFFIIGALVSRFGGIAPTPSQGPIFWVVGGVMAFIELIPGAKQERFQEVMRTIYTKP